MAILEAGPVRLGAVADVGAVADGAAVVVGMVGVVVGHDVDDDDRGSRCPPDAIRLPSANAASQAVGGSHHLGGRLLRKRGQGVLPVTDGGSTAPVSKR